MPDPEPDLDNAYALKTPQDTRRLYDNWAASYDSGFAVDHDFVLPQRVAEAFAKAGGTGPVLDFGAGTGLLGQHLHQHGIGPIDGVDLSPEMLKMARAKQIYRNLWAGNILDGFAITPGYTGIVSSGTFTNGHVGPDAISTLLSLATPGAQFALSINRQHFDAAGFAQFFKALAPKITKLTLPEIRLYGPKATDAHKDDTGYIALFRKA